MPFTPGYQVVQTIHPNEAEHRRRLAEAVNLALGGKLNASLEVTLAVSPATTTTISDPRISSGTVILWMPLTANAAANANGMWINSTTMKQGEAVITHDAQTSVDMTFRLLLIG